MYDITRRRFMGDSLLAAKAACLGTAFLPEFLSAQEQLRPLYKSQYHIIDAHTHCGAPHDDSVPAQLDIMSQTGVNKFVVLLFDTLGWKYAGGWSKDKMSGWPKLLKRFPEELIVFGTMDFNRATWPTFFQDIVQKLEWQGELGVQGIKLWKNLGMHVRDGNGKLLKIDDPRFDPYWAKCGELGLPVLIHSADPRRYWTAEEIKDRMYRYRQSWMPSWEELIRQRDAILKRHPGTTFIGAHFGSMSSDLPMVAKTLDAYPNFYVDVASRLRFMAAPSPETVREFFTKYQDRVLFGTDTFVPYIDSILNSSERMVQWKDRKSRNYAWYLEYFETDHKNLAEPRPGSKLVLSGAKLPPEVLEKFYHINAEKLIPGIRKRKI
jgi:amidohydrolase family protein